MATAADAELILKLYELRQEETLRRARRFLVFEFNPKTVEVRVQAGGNDSRTAVTTPYPLYVPRGEVLVPLISKTSGSHGGLDDVESLAVEAWAS